MIDNLHLLFVTGSLYRKSSGPYLSSFNTAKALVNKGHTTLVVGTKDNWFQGKPSDWAPVSVQAFRKVGPDSLHFTPGLSGWLRKSNVKINVASLQSIWLYNNYIASKWLRKNRIPYMVSPHGNFNPEALKFSEWKKKLAGEWFVNEILEHASCFHALTESEYKAIRKYGLKQPVCIIPNGIDIPGENELINNDTVTILRNKFAGKKICLYIGRLHPIKGLADLIQAWASLPHVNKEWMLVLVGPDDGGFMAMLQKMVEKLNLNQSILFVGPQFAEDKAAYFKVSDFYVLPSKSEGFAMTPLEAMSYRLPVLLTDACNFPTVIDVGAGIQVGVSTDELKNGLQVMMSKSRSEMEFMGEQGYQLVYNKYQWTRVADQFLDVYRWMLQKSEAPASVIFS